MKQSESITTVLNEVKYLIIEILITKQVEVDMIKERLKDCGGIYQGIKEINNGGFWSRKYVVVNVLIPENKVHDFDYGLDIK